MGLGTRLRGDFGALGALRLPTHDARSDELPHSAQFCLSPCCPRRGPPYIHVLTAPTACSLGAYRAEVSGARRGVEAQQQPGDGDHVVLHERLRGDVWAGRRGKSLQGHFGGRAVPCRRAPAALTW